MASAASSTPRPASASETSSSFAGLQTPRPASHPHPANPLVARARQASLEAGSAQKSKSNSGFENTTLSSTPIKSILRRPETPSSSSRVEWGYRMTDRGDVSKISSLADSPTRSIVASEHSAGLPNTDQSLADVTSSEDSRVSVENLDPSMSTGSSTSAHSASRRRPLNSFPDGSSLHDQSSSLDSIRSDISSSHLRSGTASSPTVRQTMDMLKTPRARAPPVRSETVTQEESISFAPSLGGQTNESHLVDGSLPWHMTEKLSAAKTPRASSSNAPSFNRVLPVGKQSPGSRVSREGVDPNDSRAFEASFSITGSLLRKESAKLLEGLRAAEKQEQLPDMPDSRELPHNLSQDENTDAETLVTQRPQSGDQHAGIQSSTASKGEIAQAEASMSTIGARRSADTSMSRQNLSALTPKRPSPLHASHADETTESQDVSYSTPRTSDFSSPFPNSRPAVTSKSPLSSRPTTPATSLRRSDSPANASFSTAYSVSPAARQAEKKAIVPVIAPAPWPSSTHSSPVKQPSPPRRHDFGERSTKRQNSQQANVSQSDSNKRRGALIRKPKSPPKISDSFIAAFPGDMKSTPKTPKSPAIPRENAAVEDIEQSVYQAFVEYDAAHDSRLSTLSTRAQQHQSEASHFRTLLSAELEAKMRLLQELSSVRWEAEEARRECDRLRQASEQERALQQARDEELQSLVEQLRQQVERRLIGGYSTASADAAEDVSEIERLHSELAKERRQRAQEKRDLEVRLALATPRSSASPAPGLSSSSPSTIDRKVLDEAVRRARDSVERDHQIQLYTIQRDHDQIVADLEAEAGALKRQLEMTSDETHSPSQVRDLEQQVADLQEALSVAEAATSASAVADDDDSEAEANNEKADLRRLLSEAQAAEEDLRATQAESETEILNLNGEIEELQGRCSQLEQDVREVEEQLTSELESRTSALTQDVLRVEEERDGLRQALFEAEGSIEELAKELENLYVERNAQIEELKRLRHAPATASENEAIFKAQAEIESLRSQLAEMTDEYEESQRQQDDLLDMKERLEKEKQELATSFAQAEQQVSDQADTMRDMHDAMDKSKASQVQDQSGISAEMEALRSKARSAEESLAAHAKQQTDLETILSQTRLRAKLLEKEVGDRGLTIAKLEKSNEHLEREIQSHSIALATKQQELSLIKRKLRNGDKLTSGVGLGGMATGTPMSLHSVREDETNEDATELLQRGPAPVRAKGRRTIEPAHARGPAMAVTSSTRSTRPSSMAQTINDDDISRSRQSANITATAPRSLRAPLAASQSTTGGSNSSMRNSSSFSVLAPSRSANISTTSMKSGGEKTKSSKAAATVNVSAPATAQQDVARLLLSKGLHTNRTGEEEEGEDDDTVSSFRSASTHVPSDVDVDAGVGVDADVDAEVDVDVDLPTEEVFRRSFGGAIEEDSARPSSVASSVSASGQHTRASTTRHSFSASSSASRQSPNMDVLEDEVDDEEDRTPTGISVFSGTAGTQMEQDLTTGSGLTGVSNGDGGGTMSLTELRPSFSLRSQSRQATSSATSWDDEDQEESEKSMSKAETLTDSEQTPARRSTTASIIASHGLRRHRNRQSSTSTAGSSNGSTTSTLRDSANTSTASASRRKVTGTLSSGEAARLMAAETSLKGQGMDVPRSMPGGLGQQTAMAKGRVRSTSRLNAVGGW